MTDNEEISEQLREIKKILSELHTILIDIALGLGVNPNGRAK